jgi:hypothetical protein
MISALFVQTNGHYYNLPDIDPWNEERDARKYTGNNKVIAHPPCARWCLIAPMNQILYGCKIGDDGGCFESALNSVRRCGGVLEHPAYSIAWKHFNLLRPKFGMWLRNDNDNSWTTQVNQSCFMVIKHERRLGYMLLAKINHKIWIGETQSQKH